MKAQDEWQWYMPCVYSPSLIYHPVADMAWWIYKQQKQLAFISNYLIVLPLTGHRILTILY